MSETKLKLAFLNALLLAGLNFATQLYAYGYPPTWQAIYSSVVFGLVVFFTTLYQDFKRIYKKAMREKKPEAKADEPKNSGTTPAPAPKEQTENVKGDDWIIGMVV